QVYEIETSSHGDLLKSGTPPIEPCKVSAVPSYIQSRPSSMFSTANYAESPGASPASINKGLGGSLPNYRVLNSFLEFGELTPPNELQQDVPERKSWRAMLEFDRVISSIWLWYSFSSCCRRRRKSVGSHFTHLASELSRQKSSLG